MPNTATIQSLPEDQLLSPGATLLYGQYTIERHLIDGGFGMTYLARDSLDRRVVIKECFPSSICQRVEGEVRPTETDNQEQFQSVIRNFLREALRLAKLEHPNVVGVHQVFQENNTAYIAMEYIQGVDLITVLEREPERLTNRLITKLLHDTLNALDYVHAQGMLHRDISPDNLLLDINDKVTMIDFGAAREEARKSSRALSTLLAVKEGYSPQEFYVQDSIQDMSSDLYSVAATFYHLVTGEAPPESQKRLAALTSDEPDPYVPLADGKWPFDKPFLDAIDRALSLSRGERIRSVEEWLTLLDAKPDTVASIPELEPDADLPDTRLEAVISSLVADTNRYLTAAVPDTATQAEDTTDESAEQEDEPPQLVDIFGNPIQDLEAWLKDQDRQSEKHSEKHSRRKKPEKAEIRHEIESEEPETPMMAAADETAEEQAPRSGLSRMLNSLVKRRSRAAATGQN
ncbi:serine/threonine protein kinase [Roseovarius pacificus]|uniref:protein kinase domain-containing protein n=1 Tax=Roseovarius pacificus TaxID=337701 RepID=UPI00403A2F10